MRYQLNYGSTILSDIIEREDSYSLIDGLLNSGSSTIQSEIYSCLSPSIYMEEPNYFNV